MTFLFLERKETINLILIRFMLLLVIVVLTLLLFKEMDDYLFFFMIIFLPLLFISVSELQIFSNSFFIKKYYFFGIVPIEYKIYKGDKVEITIIYMSASIDNDSEIPTQNIETERYKIEYVNTSGKSKSFTCKLKENEYKLIREVLSI